VPIVPAGTIGDLRDVIDAAEKAPARAGLGYGHELWWRGQADARWPLLPGVFRDSVIAGRERNLAVEFRERAGTRYAHLPAADDLPGWLFLMQHYRLPTRLLDWTESVLAATFFAVEQAEHHERPGALWGLNPSLLNEKCIGSAGLPVSDDAEIAPMFHGAFFDPVPAVTRKVAAVGTREVDIRMLVQLSAFTIHTTPDALDATPGAPEYLVRYEIPADQKKRLLHQLRLTGIRRSTLFPDLENLARELSGPSTF